MPGNDSLLQFPERGAGHATQGHLEKHQGWSGGSGIEGKTWARVFPRFPGKNWQGRGSRLKVGGLSVLRGSGVHGLSVSSGLPPQAWM